MYNYQRIQRNEGFKLFVGELPLNYNRSELISLFKQSHPTCEVEVNYGKKSTSAIIYAKSQDEAIQIKNEFNFRIFENREMRVTDFDFNIWKGQGKNLFIKNLPPDYKSKDLYNFYTKFGEIFSAKVCYDDKGNSKGFGFVCFKEAASAKTAIQTSNHSEINGKIIEVFEHTYSRGGMMIPKKCIYINNIPETYSDKEKFKSLFIEYGNIVNIDVKESVLKEKNGENRKGFFGYVSFENEAVASKVKEAFSGKVIDDHILYVNFIKSKIERAREKEAQRKRNKQDTYNRTLYVKHKNCDITLNESQIKDMFQFFGEVKSVFIKTYEGIDANGVPIKKNSHIVFIEFTKDESLKNALTNYKEGQFELTKLIDRQTRMNFNKPKRNFNAPINHNFIPHGFLPYNFPPKNRRGGYRSQSIPRRPQMQRMAPRMLQFPGNFEIGPVIYEPNMMGPFPFSGENPGKYPGMPIMPPNMVPMNPPMMAYNRAYIAPMNNMPPPVVRVSEIQLENAPMNEYFHPPQEVHKEQLGELIFEKISRFCSEQTRGKITGMLLELDQHLLQEILEDEQKLIKIVDDAKSLLETKVQ